MLKQKKYGRFSFIVIALLLSAQSAFAIDEWYKALPLLGNLGQIKKDSVITVQDDVFFDPSLKPNQTTYNVKNYLSLKINEASGVLLPNSFNITVYFKVYATRVDGNGNQFMDSTTSSGVNVTYSNTNIYTNKSVFTFNGAYRAKIKITGFSDTTGMSTYIAALMIENEMVVSREYNFSCTNNVVTTVNTDTSYLATKGELRVSWPKDKMADEYDLEWTYVDQSALPGDSTGGAPDPKKIFANNASRVSITKEEYYIPMLYDNTGTLFYRVRPVQIKYSGQRLEAKWSSDIIAGLGRYVYNGGHEPTLNWQSTTSFAEEGKRKSVVQYYDGSLRSRQTVTKDNTTDTTIVAETMYDFQGRPVIQVLPAPSLSSMIKYTPNFNTDINNAEYDKTKYDDTLTSSNYCGVGAVAMSVLSGASNYYSPSNPNKNNGWNKYIPDAKGFPFAETKYTQDNTGRISSQGGVGPDHQIGKTDPLYNDSHETKYFYGSADQEDIDALFGSEAGNASHYFKNMVRDANGQYSVSYVDMHGRTIATALAGKPTASLDSLTSSRIISITKKLIDSVNNIKKGTVIESSKSLVVTRAGMHSFNYSLNADSLKLNTCTTSSICYDCLYNLTITITDDCNNQSLPGNQPYVVTDSNFTIPNIDTVCNAPAGFNKSFSVSLKEGTYLVTKKLSVSKYGMDYYRDSVFLVKNTCKTQNDFINVQRQLLLSQIDCAPSCAKCSIDTFRNWTLYRPYYLNQVGIAVSDTAAYQSQALVAYNQQLKACDEVCGNTTLATSIRRQMLADVSPPSGQYANPGLVDENSIFAASPSNTPNKYRYNDVYNYLNEDGKADTIFYGDGTYDFPKNLGINDFVSNFKDSWADSLLRLHPEYCKLKLYESNPSFTNSHQWDILFQNTNTYKDAKANGFLNPLGYTDVVAQPSSIIRDPFFDNAVNPVYANTWRSVLNDSMRMRAKYTGSAFLDIWSLATAMAQCGNGNTTCYDGYNGNGHPFDIDTSCGGTLDMAWRFFRQMYMAKKTEIMGKILGQACNAFINIDETKHTLNFPDPAKLTQSIPGTIQSGTDSLNHLINNSCTSYAMQWWNELAPCNYTSADSLIIFPRLIKVCSEGGDINHPFGSSTIKPTSSNYYRSFADVINAYNDSLRTASSPRNILASQCNAYIISAPAAYDNRPSYGNQEIWNKPDSCTCSTINYLFQQYQVNGRRDANFSAYLYRTNGTVVTNTALDSLRNLCSGAITCKYLATPIILPPVLQCGVKNACANCSMVYAAYTKFKTAFPGIVPLYDNTDSLQRAYNILFERFMNYNLGFGKASTDYLQFMDSCGIKNPVSRCDTLQKLVYDFKTTSASTIPNTYTPHYDAGGCDTTTIKIDLGGITYNSGVTLGECIHDGILQLPQRKIDSLKQAGVTRGIDFDWVKANLCIDTTIGFTFETSIKLPDSTFTHPPFDRWWIYLGPDFDPSEYHTNVPQPIGEILAAIKYSGPYGVAMCTHAFYPDPTPKVCAGDIAPLHPLDNWTNVKLKLVGRQCYYYINDTLQAQRTLDFPISKLYYWAFSCFSLSGAVDYVRIYNNTGGMLYDEEFNGCASLARPTDLANQCSQVCPTAFTQYFNQQQHTAYGYTQIDSVYSSCGILLRPCTDTLSPLLCGKSDPAFPPVALKQYSPCDDSTNFAVTTATLLYNAYKDSLTNTFNDKYLGRCLNAYKTENFTVTQPMSEFHYTLYYYDQAGNLVRTVPPEGVDMTVYSRTTYFDSVKTARNNGTVYKPKHQYKTNYRYNALNQVMTQTTPDAGLSNFWYDRLGRLVISENARQKAASATENNRQYSYTTYDYLGRINEVGQLNNTTANGAMTDVVSRNGTSLNTWMLNLTNKKEQVTRTFYDLAYPYVNTIPLNAVNLRNRVAYTTLTNDYSTTNFNAGTFYSYDIHGNVDTLLQDFGSSTVELTKNIMNRNSNRWIRMVYKYDLISGKVNHVAYNPKYYDVTTKAWITPYNQFYHRYSYDAENRLTMVETSSDSVMWDKDARYEYYKHGPLARMLIGDQLVQGLDYAYTLLGWLKGVNSTSTTTNTDMGGDGKTGGQNVNVARDIVGYSLNYFTGDYTPINNNYNPFPGTSAYLGTAYKPLYNGNISSMAVNIKPLNQPYLYNYKYDQLNRLTGMDTYSGLDTTNNNWTALTPTKAFNERVSYDGNGNIKKYNRYYTNTTVIMDSLTYNYTAGTNKLSSVTDLSQGWVNGNYKIKNQVANNYNYDEIGNLIKDSSEYIPTNGIKWNVYGKISEINHTQAGTLFSTRKINYYYDAAGNRIGKKVTKFGNANVAYTWYVRDAQGNVMNVYTAAKDTVAVDTTLSPFSLLWAESHIYGSSRLGIQNRNVTAEPPNPQGGIYYNTRGKRFYELTNHLGNVLAVISDKKLVHTSNGSSLDYYNTDVVSATDFYPFGMVSRYTYLGNQNLGYRYSFNGKENDADVKGDGNQVDYGMRVYDPRIGRFLSVDELTRKYPWNSPYAFAENDVIRSIDLDGLEKFLVVRSVDNNNNLIHISISSFEDENGNAQDNEFYNLHPKLKLEKANVYVITENATTGKRIGSIEYKKSLTVDQAKVYNQFGVKRSVEKIMEKEGGVGRQLEILRSDNSAKYLAGKLFTTGTEVEADLNLRVSLNIPFIGGTSTPVNLPTATSQLSGIARTLKTFPKSNALIIGNTGNDPGSTTPIGNSSLVLGTGNIQLNGGISTIGGVMNARANAIKGILNNTFKISNARLNTVTGTNAPTPAGRTVDIQINNLRL